MSDFDRIVDEIRAEFPRVRIVPKHESRLMRLAFNLGLMRLWCPRFMETYTTVFGSTIAMPAWLIGTTSGARVLRHERVHLRDARSWPVLFHLSYVLLPIGPSFRALWELRAYRETLRCELEATGRISDGTLAFVASQFTGSSYLWMWPFPGHIRSLLARMRDELLLER